MGGLGTPSLWRPWASAREPPRGGSCPSVHRRSELAINRWPVMTGRRAGPEGKGQQTDARGHAPHLLECHPFPCQKSLRGASQLTDAPRRRGGCRPPPRWPAVPGFFPLPCFPGACYIVSWHPRGRTSDAGKRVCILFCGGGVSEPRTYLANEVVITPGLTNRMKARGSLKSH